jgi:glutaredoxin
MTRKTGNKWSTEKCSRCEEVHVNYSGKLDKNNIEYVVCEIINKRMNVLVDSIESNNFTFPTIWINQIKL